MTPTAVAVAACAPSLMDYFAADTKYQAVQQVHLRAIFVATLHTAHPVALIPAAIQQGGAQNRRSHPSASSPDLPAVHSQMWPTAR